jgi:hypothetical protein
MRLEWTTVSMAAIALLASCARPDDRCAGVGTTIVTSYTQGPACTSPVGVCTSGSIASGDLAGTTQFTALTIDPGPSPELLVYTGDLLITTATGTVTFHDTGLLNSATGYYIEMQEVVSGTGAYDQQSGMLMSQGIATATGFAGDLYGSICAVH